VLTVLPALMVLAGGCADLPRDQDGWTQRVRKSGVLPVGVPGRSGEHALMEDRERRLVEEAARRLHARVQWRPGNVHVLLEELKERKIPVVAATLPTDSPFAAEVGLSQPYLKKGPGKKDYCLAVAPGENRLLLLIDTVIADERRRAGER
jgi:hypothetical protein